ncbi:hypothetical protein KH5H1_29450 [Corallococcus caeni]|nr:hypothetical protein KH5H1_29450 [Corallococcus sp. KH5-1]
MVGLTEFQGGHTWLSPLKNDASTVPWGPPPRLHSRVIPAAADPRLGFRATESPGP